MANEIGTTLLNSLTNSTFDIGNMSKVLAEAEVAGPRAIVERNQEKATTKLDALTYLEANLNAFKSYVTDLADPSLFSNKSTSSSNESTVTATATGSAQPGSYQIESKQLAQYHTLVANKSYSSQYDGISTGTLDISVGGQSHSITVDSSNNTLDGLKRYINSGDFGVSASVVNTGSGYQLMFTSKQQGASGEMSISGISDIDTDGLTTTSEAQDAIMAVNGLEVANSSNTFDGVIEGMSFQLNSANPGQTSTVAVANDTQQVSDGIKALVEVYNQLGTILDELGSYDQSELTEEQLESDEYLYYGDLAGSSTLKQTRTAIDNALAGAIDELFGDYTSLVSVGIKSTLDGTLELDETELNNVINNNFDALSGLFAKGGYAADNLINILDGSDQTIDGTYQLEVIQLAERAEVVAGAAATVSTDEKVAGARISNAQEAQTIDASALLDISVGGVNQVIDLSALAQTYSTKDDVALALQGALDTAYGGSVATVAYDVSQARFEITANSGQGAVLINSATNLSNQGFTSGTSYSGEGLIDLTSGDASFDIKVDDSDVDTVTIQSGRYTLSELAFQMTTAINNGTNTSAAGNTVTVSENSGTLSIASTRFGGNSLVEITNISPNLANSGFTADLTDQGQNVDGTITTASGTLNIGAYAESDDGRIINISDFAIIGSEDAEVRGLRFEVLGGQYDGGGALITDRGDISFANGFASRLEASIDGLFDADTGVIQRKMDSLTSKLDDYKEKSDAIDARYEKLESKYQMDLSILQSLIASSEATRNQLSAQFSNNNN